jgi:nucleoside-diphosphate-sugar epimerase
MNMAIKRVFLTGATGGMGSATLDELLKDRAELKVVVLARKSAKNEVFSSKYAEMPEVEFHWGDLTVYEDVLECVRGSDFVLHVGAFVSPEADYKPQEAMRINYGSTVNIIKAIHALGQAEETKLVYIGTVAETGDRMPPIHWGRVGDPLKPSVFDYYAVSKIAAERAVIESGLKYWASLRQTGILAEKMTDVEDAIMFHNCLDNVLEYVSDRDSALLMRNVVQASPSEFWGHVYNIGGGESCRLSTYKLFSELFGRLGIKKLPTAIDSKWFGLRNFHGQYYLDSDKLEELFHFRRDSMDYYYGIYLKKLGATVGLSRIITKLPLGQRLIGGTMKKKFLALARTEHGTVRFIEQNMEGHIAAYYGSKAAYDRIPKLEDMEHFKDWNKVVCIDHGYDETKPETELDLEDMKGAATFRGGTCESTSMSKGDWSTKLEFRCAFGHEFAASPRLVLEGGHWCPVCERESWDYQNIAKVNPFFAQVWYPLHPKDEKPFTYKKIVSELDVKLQD